MNSAVEFIKSVFFCNINRKILTFLFIWFAVLHMVVHYLSFVVLVCEFNVNGCWCGRYSTGGFTLSGLYGFHFSWWLIAGMHLFAVLLLTWAARGSPVAYGIRLSDLSAG